MKTPLHVLIIEDSEDDALLLARQLRHGGCDVIFERVDTPEALSVQLETGHWDIILADYVMPSFSAPEALKLVQDKGVDIPFIILSGIVSEEVAVKAMKAGADDFLSKDKLARLVPAVERELLEAENRRKRREVEQKLRESEQYFRLIAENTLDLISITNDEGCYVYVSPSFEALLGHTAESLLTQPALDLVHPEDRQHLANWSPQGSVELRLKKARYGWLWVEAVRYPITMQGQLYLVTIGRDVTDRKQAEVKLKRYNKRLSTLHAIDRAILTAESPEAVCNIALEFIVSQMDSFDAHIMLFDPQTRQGTVFAGRSRDGTKWLKGGSVPIEVFSTDVIKVLEAGVSQVVNLVPDDCDLPISPGAHLVMPLIAHDKLMGSLNLGVDHPDRFDHEQAEIVREIANQLAIAIQQARYREEIQRYATDLEQRVVERTAELQQIKDRLEVILNNASDSLVLTDFDAIIRQVNPAFRDLFGYDPEDILGHSLLDLVVPEQVDVLLDALSISINGGHASRVEVTSWFIDNTSFEADIAIAPISQDGKILGLVCSVRDITQRKKAEAELRSALEQEKALNELKSQFTSMVSHEFRTPLSVILSSAGLLQKYLDRLPDEKRRRHLDQIEVQVKRLVSLLDEVLAFSRADFMAKEISAEPFDLAALCGEISTEMQQTTRLHNVDFTITGEQRSILGDVTLMRQVISNLLSNAIKYSPDGGTVNLDLIYDERQVSLRVQDEGIGIPPEDQKRLFDLFPRAGNVGSIAGTGLGLAIIKRAIEAHKGTIVCESETGVGTTFTIRIPTHGMIDE